jgi:hypothetical protein
MKAWIQAWKSEYMVVPAVLFAFGLIIAGVAADHFWGAPLSCTKVTEPADGWPTGAFIAVIGGFLLGGLLGGFRPRGSAPTAGFWTHLSLTALLAVILIAWAYETFALASDGSFYPITSFIMCVKHGANDWTVTIFVLAAIMLGRWLWRTKRMYFL